MNAIYTISYRMLLSSWLLASMWACNHSDASNKQAYATADSLTVATTRNRVLGVGRIEPQEGILSITAGTEGKILQVAMEENQLVYKGQVLLSIDIALEQAQLAQATSKLATQQATILSSKATLEALHVSLQQALTTYLRNQKLFEAKAQTRQALDESKAETDRLTKEAEAAKARVEEASSRLNELQSDITYYRTLIARKQVTAPVSGKILKVAVQAGDYVTGATQVAEFAADGPLVAKTEVDELYAERVQKGQKAYLFSQTTGDTLATGTISFTADYFKQKSLFKDQSTELEDRRVREVHIRLHSGKMPLIGSRVDCLIVF
ncbi:biotin/lipoyl-binding protein [Rhodocytophaga aerolata]|uniref:Biotin/lipoyl-binding protein n=1 Tax=Rhodocytophaga aerolata TaxID=455078 RepID=A0ABT8R726_9BACT|nr:biotin/lipoyl-binding protein [Rhodocytophaga aerolata]MDO1446998.1 biotin/lipoyl-binding protein [Rhodocytophaga aerolata]